MSRKYDMQENIKAQRTEDLSIYLDEAKDFKIT